MTRAILLPIVIAVVVSLIGSMLSVSFADRARGFISEHPTSSFDNCQMGIESRSPQDQSCSGTSRLLFKNGRVSFSSSTGALPPESGSHQVSTANIHDPTGIMVFISTLIRVLVFTLCILSVTICLVLFYQYQDILFKSVTQTRQRHPVSREDLAFGQDTRVQPL